MQQWRRSKRFFFSVALRGPLAPAPARAKALTGGGQTPSPFFSFQWNEDHAFDPEWLSRVAFPFRQAGEGRGRDGRVA